MLWPLIAFYSEANPAVTRKLDLSACWNDVMQLFRRERDLLLSIAGVFVLLPSLAFAMFVPQPVTPQDADFTVLAETMRQFYINNIFWIALVGLANGFATVAMLMLMFDRARPSVAEAMRRALALLLPYYAMGIMSTVAVFLGSLAFVLPGIYIFIKFVIAGPVMVAERMASPVAALRRSWQLTKGNTGRVLIFVVIVAVTAFFIYLTSVTVLGLVIRLAVPADIAETLTTLVDSVLSMFLTVLMVCVYAAIYRQLAEPDTKSVASAFD